MEVRLSARKGLRIRKEHTISLRIAIILIIEYSKKITSRRTIIAMQRPKKIILMMRSISVSDSSCSEYSPLNSSHIGKIFKQS